MSVVVLGAPAPVLFSDSPNIDAFSRLRVGNPYTLFDSKQTVDNQPLFWNEAQTSGSGTGSEYMTYQSAVRLYVSNVTAGTRVRQTYERFNYQPGKSQAIFITGILGASATGITRKIGYFDEKNGLFFQLSGSTLSVVVRTFTSGIADDNIIPQSQWNLDKLDGNGPSGILINTEKSQIFVIDFQWLGVGRVRFGVDIGGKLIYVHEELHANLTSIVYISNPNLPVRFEISNDGTGSNANLIHICACVISEGGRDDTGFILSADRGSTVLTTLNNTNIYPLLAFRLKSTYQSATIDIENISLVNTSGDSFRYCVLLNPTVTGTALSFTSITNSALEADLATTNGSTLSGGTQIISGYEAASTTAKGAVHTKIPTNLRIGSTIGGISDIMVIGAQRLSGTTSSFYAGFTWRELV